MIHPPVVYFCKPVGLLGPIKVGCTTNSLERLQQLMSWSPVDLEIVASVPGDFRLERLIHSILSEHHIRHEWFHPCDALVSGIIKLKAGDPIEVAFDLAAPKGSIAKKRAGKVWTEWRKKLVSYSSRLRFASDRLDTDGEYFTFPDDVKHIIGSWRRTSVISPRDIDRLNEVLAHPGAHFVRHERTVPRIKAAKAPASDFLSSSEAA